jgi:hypothetical protein
MFIKECTYIAQREEERRVLRKIYGPTQNSDGKWRVKT